MASQTSIEILYSNLLSSLHTIKLNKRSQKKLEENIDFIIL